jgi:hypothetical protein
MSEKTNILEKMRKSRMENILSNPPSGFMVNSGFRRFLCVIAVLFSYIYFAKLLLPQSDCMNSPCHVVNQLTVAQTLYLLLMMIVNQWAFYAPLIMAISFFLLRRSMRRVTSLPDEYLDEREIANRDWAFKLGYLVIRRVGLVVAVVFFVLSTIGYKAGSGQFSPPPSNTVVAMNAFKDYLKSLIAYDALGYLFGIIGLLTYVAYSFPLILVAWRESKFPEPIPVPKETTELETPRTVARKYFLRLLIVLGLIALYVGLTALAFIVPAFGEWLTFKGGIFFLLFGFVVYAMFVYVWASIKTVQVLTQAKQNGQFSMSATWALVFFALTQFLGLALLFGFPIANSLASAAPNTNPLVFLVRLGFAMIPAQVLSFVFLRRIGEANKGE